MPPPALLLPIGQFPLPEPVDQEEEEGDGEDGGHGGGDQSELDVGGGGRASDTAAGPAVMVGHVEVAPAVGVNVS